MTKGFCDAMPVSFLSMITSQFIFIIILKNQDDPLNCQSVIDNSVKLTNIILKNVFSALQYKIFKF